VLAALDPDPAGIQIALAVADGAGVELSACRMSPEALWRATPLPLTDQDRRWLIKLEGRASVFEPLRAAIAERDHKGEQEPIHGWLDAEIAEHICAAAP